MTHNSMNMGLSVKLRNNNAKKSMEEKSDVVVTSVALQALVSQIEIKPLTQSEIESSRIKAYQPVY